MPASVLGLSTSVVRVSSAPVGETAIGFAMPKSSTFTLILRRDHHVARLEIAVHDAGRMRGRERIRDLDADSRLRLGSGSGVRPINRSRGWP